jgi:hypothetical protein
VFFGCAQEFGRRLQQEEPVGGEHATVVERRAQRAFLVALGRRATEDETSILAALDHETRRLLADDVAAARTLAGAGAAEPDDAVLDRAACVMLARAVLNTDEFITRE